MAEGKRLSMKYSSKGTFKLSPGVLMNGASSMSVELVSLVNHWGSSVVWMSRVGLYAGSEGGCWRMPPGMRDVVTGRLGTNSIAINCKKILQ